MSSILGEFDSFSDVDAVSALEGRIAQSSGGTQDSYRFALLQLLSKRVCACSTQSTCIIGFCR